MKNKINWDYIEIYIACFTFYLSNFRKVCTVFNISIDRIGHDRACFIVRNINSPNGRTSPRRSYRGVKPSVWNMNSSFPADLASPNPFPSPPLMYRDRLHVFVPFQGRDAKIYFASWRPTGPVSFSSPRIKALSHRNSYRAAPSHTPVLTTPPRYELEHTDTRRERPTSFLLIDKWFRINHRRRVDELLRGRSAGAK